MIWKKISVLVLMLVFCHCLAQTEINVPGMDENDPEPAVPFQLTVSPAQVNRFSSDGMTLRCSRNADIQTSMVQIQRMRIVKKSEAVWTLVADQRDEIDTAVQRNLTASANINGPISNGFLQVSWDKIGDDNFGVFRCDVMGFDAEFDPVIENSHEVVLRESDVPDEFFVNLWKETEEKISDLRQMTRTEIVFLKEELKDVKTKQSSCENRVSALEARLSSLQTRFSALEIKQSSSQQRLNTLGSFKDSLTQWPEGHYALLQPKTGCPVDLTFFSGTHRYQKIHTEFGSNTDGHSAVFLPTTKFFIGNKRFFTIELCESHGRFNSGRSWPRGSYCIHKLRHKSCPWPFIDGNVFFDTEDDDASNEGRNNAAHSGQNLRLYFCCQNSGSATTPIQLPTETPFILYRKGGTCQAVKDMSASYHQFHVDTEDDNNQDDTHGTIPDVDRPYGRNFRFHLCYYSPL